MFTSQKNRLTRSNNPWAPTLAVGLALLGTQASAVPVSTLDTTPTGAVADANIGVGEYIHSETGIGSSFSNSFGTNSQLFMDSDATTLYIGVNMFAALNSTDDVGVIYLDTTTGGFSTTTGLVGNGNNNENAIAANLIGGASADLTFATGFTADYAITIEGNGFIGLYAIDNNANGTPDFIDGYGLGGGSFNHIISGLSSNDERVHEIAIPLATLGLAQGGTINYFGTVLSGSSLHRSNEFFGVASNTIVGVNNDGFNNIAVNDFSLAEGDFSSFTVVPEPGSLLLTATGSLLIALRRRRNA